MREIHRVDIEGVPHFRTWSGDRERYLCEPMTLDVFIKGQELDKLSYVERSMHWGWIPELAHELVAKAEPRETWASEPHDAGCDCEVCWPDLEWLT